MRIRRPWLVLVLLLVPTIARAHNHFADVCFGVSDAHESMLVGPFVTVSKTFETSTDSKLRNLSLIGDLSTHWGSHDDLDVRRVFFMGGLRYTFAGDQHQKHLPFVEVLLGGVHNKDDDGNGNSEGDADPALAIGAGYEHVMSGSPYGWGIRVQGGYIVRPGDVTPRISVGLVKRFGK